MDLEDHAALLEGEAAVVGVLGDRDALAVRPHVDERAGLVRFGDVEDDVDVLACGRERLLEGVVVVRRDQELSGLRMFSSPVDRRELREQTMELVRLVETGEDRVQLLVERRVSRRSSTY